MLSRRQVLALLASAARFEPTWESLSRYRCPDWFRDAKLGIFLHWGPMSVPGVDAWYARNMYMEGSAAYRFHLKTYGHPSKFGYKDIIPLLVRSLTGEARVARVDLLGSGGPLRFSGTPEGLAVTAPAHKLCEHAFALRITLT